MGSEDTVGRPKNYQAKVPGTVSRTKRSANFSRPQVKHFLGCKKRTKSNTCGSLFTCSGALLFPSTKTAKFQNPCISGHGAFACILYHVSTQEIHCQNLKPNGFLGWQKHRKTGKSVSLSTLLSPLHVNFPGVSDFFRLANFYVGRGRHTTEGCLRRERQGYRTQKEVRGREGGPRARAR